MRSTSELAHRQGTHLSYIRRRSFRNPGNGTHEHMQPNTWVVYSAPREDAINGNVNGHDVYGYANGHNGELVKMNEVFVAALVLSKEPLPQQIIDHGILYPEAIATQYPLLGARNFLDQFRSQQPR